MPHLPVLLTITWKPLKTQQPPRQELCTRWEGQNPMLPTPGCRQAMFVVAISAPESCVRTSLTSLSKVRQQGPEGGQRCTEGVSQTKPGGEADMGHCHLPCGSLVQKGRGCLLTKVKASKALSIKHHKNVAGAGFNIHMTVVTGNLPNHMGVRQRGGVVRAFTQIHRKLQDWAVNTSP